MGQQHELVHPRKRIAHREHRLGVDAAQGGQVVTWPEPSGAYVNDRIRHVGDEPDPSHPRTAVSAGDLPQATTTRPARSSSPSSNTSRKAAPSASTRTTVRRSTSGATCCCTQGRRRRAEAVPPLPTRTGRPQGSPRPWSACGRSAAKPGRASGRSGPRARSSHSSFHPLGGPTSCGSKGDVGVPVPLGDVVAGEEDEAGRAGHALLGRRHVVEVRRRGVAHDRRPTAKWERDVGH
jgi:hypothetical protein